MEKVHLFVAVFQIKFLVDCRFHGKISSTHVIGMYIGIQITDSAIKVL